MGLLYLADHVNAISRTPFTTNTSFACALQDVVMMCQTIEKLFEQKLQAMPKEVSSDSASLVGTYSSGLINSS